MRKELTRWGRELRWWVKDLRLFLLKMPSNRIERKAWVIVHIVWMICLTLLAAVAIRPY